MLKLLTLALAAITLLTACTRSVDLIIPAENPAGDRVATQNPAGEIILEVGFHARAVQGNFAAELDGIPITANFPAAGNPRSASVATPPGAHTLRLAAPMSPTRIGDSVARNYSLSVLASPIPPPTSVTALAPASGPVGTSVAVSGTGFHSSHPVRFGGSTVSSTHINATEKQFQVPQRATGSHAVNVAGVGALSFGLTTSTLGVAPASVTLLWGGSETLTVTLPLAAPPGGVDLNATASPSGLLQVSGQGNLHYSTNNTGDSLQLSTSGLGSGTITVSGAGYSSANIPFSISMGTPQCSVRARAAGGVEFVSLTTGSVVGSLSSTQVPGRIATAPGGARAVAQYLNGISFLDLVNCSGLGSFQSSTIPLNNFAFSGDGQFFAADWFHNSQNDGLVAYWLADASQLFSRNTTSNSLNVLIAADATGAFAFWVTSTNTPGGAQPQLGIHALTDAPDSCFVGNVPSNNISVSMLGGTATVEFSGVPGNPNWQIRTSGCQVLP